MQRRGQFAPQKWGQFKLLRWGQFDWNFHPDPTYDIGYGLYLEGCASYQVEDNTFTTSGSIVSGNPANSGLFVANNNSLSTMIYRNHFNYIEIGIRSQNNNSGLQIKCNDFTSLIGKQNILVSSGALPNQGNCGTTALPAGNIFSHDCTSTFDDYKIQNPVPSFNYYHHSDRNPVCYSPLLLVHNCGYNSTSLSCPSLLPNPCGEGSSNGASMMLLANAYGKQLDSLYSIIDGGNTAELLNKIAESEISINDLNEVGPYLSDTVLTSLVSEPVITTIDLLDILEINSPIDTTISETLIGSDAYIVPAEIANDLSEPTVSISASGNEEIELSPLQQIEDEINYKTWERQSFIENAIGQYIIEGNIDSAIIVLTAEGADWAKMQSVQLNFTKGDFSAASSIVNSISDNTDESTAFKTLWQVRINLELDERGIKELSEEEKNTLRDIGSKQTMSGIAALNMLRMANGEFTPEIIDSIYEDEVQNREAYTTDAINSNSSIYVYPNPVNTILYIQVLGENMINTKEIRLFNIDGKLLKTISISENTTSTWLNVETMPKGVYFIETTNSENISVRQEFVVQ